jgi:hypothetical protein
MAGYSATPLWKKLGYKDKLDAYAEGAPPNYLSSLELPPDVGVQWLTRPKKAMGFVHLFTTSKRALAERLRALRRIVADDAVIWISWPKKSAGVTTDLTEDRIREIALPLGMVDIKVCAVDEVWSGLKLMIRRELRKSRN